MLFYWLDNNISQGISLRSLAHLSFAVESRGSHYCAWTSGRKEGRMVAIRQFLLVVHHRNDCWVRRRPAYKRIGKDSCYHDRPCRVDVDRYFSRGSCSRRNYRSCGTRCRDEVSLAALGIPCQGLRQSPILRSSRTMSIYQKRQSASSLRR